MIGAINNSQTVILTSAAAIILGLTTLWWHNRYQKKHRNSVPKKWRVVGEVDELALYPLKSGRKMQITEGKCTSSGLLVVTEGQVELRDRSFLVYNEKNGSFQTARLKPRMVLINVSVGLNGKVLFESPDMTWKLEINIPESSSQHRICSMWFEEKVETVDCGEEAAAWFSEFILGKDHKTGMRLGFYPGSEFTKIKRNVESLPWSKVKKYFTKIRNEDYGIYSDMASYMILGANSVAELNTRLATPVSADNFRPSIVVRGSEPYAEDNWDWIKIGDSSVFRSTKPCTRCVMTTVDPKNGIMDKATQEPLKTLKKYRKLTDPGAVAVEGESPVLGLYMGLHVPGIIKVGDKVYVGNTN